MLVVLSFALGGSAIQARIERDPEDALPETTPQRTPVAPALSQPPLDAAAPSVSPTPLGYIPPSRPQVVPIIYRFFDWANDWQTLHPEYGPIGSIHFTMWETVNPAQGVYDWTEVDNLLAKESKFSVTLQNGQVISKPVVIQIFP